MLRRLISVLVLLTVTTAAMAQRYTDPLDRGLVAIKKTNGIFCSWRIQAEEYYDVTYNLYRDGVKVNDQPLTVSNYTDAAGTISSQYTVRPVVRGQEKEACSPVIPWENKYLEISLAKVYSNIDGSDITSQYEPNDISMADLDGDGQPDILLKRKNMKDANDLFPVSSKDFDLLEAYKLDGTRLWWIEVGPNMVSGSSVEINIVAYDWDEDGKAEVLLRGADGMVLHKADGTTQTIGNASVNTRNSISHSANMTYTNTGAEFLLYLEGTTGNPYQVMDYPLPRGNANDWGDGYGHRSSKYFFGAPFLDGRKPSIFLARGIYTRHKMVAYDVDPTTHTLTQRWYWECLSAGSPWYGQGFHNYGIADVDWDGRDEIVYGSMVIDDNGHGLSTTGLGHGDAQHCSDFNPYIHGQEIFTCNEDNPNNNYRDATTSKIYYRSVSNNDDGRSMMGNFTDQYPGSQGVSAHDASSIISSVVNDHIDGATTAGIDENFRIYWDGDLLEETFNYSGWNNSNYSETGSPRVVKYGSWSALESFPGTLTCNGTKGTPCFQGDILGDWREELVLRTTDHKLRIYSTTIPTPYRIYSLWYDMQYRQAMVWEMCGYNQPPHTSYFLGKAENIVLPPPPLTLRGRTEVGNGATIGSQYNGEHLLLCETGDMSVSVTDGASPYILTDNAPTWVQGHSNNNNITKETYTHTLTGGAFSGEMRLVKQGDGILRLPTVTETYSGSTDIWAGTLQFDGTLQNSHVWMNRFGELDSDGGHFDQGIEMQYASVLRPGGPDKVGTITTSALQLGFGARVAFDLYPGEASDQIVVTGDLTIEKKTWAYGPEYDAPVFHFTVHGNGEDTRLEQGRYALGTAAQIVGDISHVIIEGLSGQKASLSYDDGTLYLDVEALRAATDVVWTGSEGTIWDFAGTTNFRSSDNESDIFVSGDHVIFNDEAVSGMVEISGPVSPASITFENNQLTYTISGDSIIGQCDITKNGSGEARITNVNRFNGLTTIHAGTLTVNSLANATGAPYGALGGVGNDIQLSGGTLKLSTTTTGSQRIVLGEGGGSIEVPANTTFSTTAPLSAPSKDRRLTKKGGGTLSLGTVSGVGAIVVEGGTLQAGESGDIQQYPDTVVLSGGVMRDVDNIYSYSTNRVNVKVPEGKSGTWYLDQRCNYTGRLEGAGTIDIYATGPRITLAGNWSNFTGTVNARGQKTGSYDPEFTLNNSNGLRQGTLNVQTRVSNNGKAFSIGHLTGGNTLAGSGRYTIGYLNKDITFSGTLDGCLITKVGSGIWTLTTPATNIGNGNVEVRGGTLNINNTQANSLFFGSNQVVAQDSGTIGGRGYLQSVIVQNGGTLRPGNLASNYNVGQLKVAGNVYAYAGSHLNLFIFNASNTSSSRSFLEVGNTLSINGDITVTMRNYTPQAGDEIHFWSAKTLTGTPTAIYLPDLSEYGLAWDTTDLLQPEGILRVVTYDSGIGDIADNTPMSGTVYTLSGMYVGYVECTRSQLATALRRQGLGRGTYIVRLSGSRQTTALKVTLQ